MPKAGSRVFVQIPSVDDERILHCGSLLEVPAPEQYRAEFEAELDLSEGLDVLLWYEQQREFMQQCARVAELERGPGLRVLLQTVGEPISGEQRRHSRVSTAGAGVTASVAQETACSVLDVSASGFAVVTRGRHAVGTTFPAALQFRGEQFEGRVCVQNHRAWGEGLFRHGLRGVDTAAGAGNLMTCLTQISLAVQSELLTRPR